MVMGSFQFFTTGEIPRTMMGVRNTVPSRMERMVPVGALPHLSQMVFLHPLGVGSDGGALHGHAVFLGGVGGVDGDLISGLIPPGQAQVVVFCDQVHVGE